LLPDDCTLVYTSEGRRVLRFNVCTSTQMSDLAILSGGGNSYGLSRLANDDLLIADDNDIRRLDAQGASVATYDGGASNAEFFGIAADPDGTSFWVTDLANAVVHRFSLTTGLVLLTFPTGGVPGVEGGKS
jgi:DNA-binding beta-propeller fold protein YncE